MAKRTQITDNDIRDIFEPLSRYAQLSTRQLVALGQRHPVITKARLGEIWHATSAMKTHWLHRLNEDILFANHLTTEDLHRIGVEAEALLIQRGMISPEPWIAASRIGGRSTAPSRIIRLAHDHAAANIVLDIEIGARAADAPFRSHLDILKVAPEKTRAERLPLRIPIRLDDKPTFVEPDALFAIGSRAFALEADKGTESVSAVIVQKILAYREIVAARTIDERFGIDNLTVLFVTSGETRMHNIMREVARIARNGRSSMFAFRADPELAGFLSSAAPDGKLFRASWKRVGHEDCMIASS